MVMGSPQLPNMQTIDMTKSDGEKVEMTQEEMQRFQQCMKDPEFMDLWADYAKEISDPKNLKEQEEYLKQVEREANEQGDYSFTFIFPKANFCVRVNTKQRVYINICDDEKVDEPVEETTGRREASSWQVPICMGKIRDEEHNDKPVKVIDACYHPKSTFLAKRSDKFMVFLVEIAIENINNAYAKDLGGKLPMEFSRVTETNSIGNPAAQTIRIKAVKGKEGELVVESKKKQPEPEDPKSAFSGDGGFADRLAASMGSQDAKQRLKAEKEAQKAQKQAEELAKLKALEEKRKAEKEAAEAFKRNLAAGLGAKPKTKLPGVTVTHVGEIGYSDCWNTNEQPERRLPKQLKVCIPLPMVGKVSEVDMHIEPRAVSITIEKHDIEEDIQLAYEVDPDSGKAKFEKNKKVLTVTLPVVQQESEFEREYKAKKAEERRQFSEEAKRQEEEETREREEEETREREEEERKVREAREEEERVERERAEEEAKRRKAVEDLLEKAAEEERKKRALEAERKEQEIIQKRLKALEATKASINEQEEATRRAAEEEHQKAMRKIKREIEAVRHADSMAQISLRKQQELPFVSRFIYELD